MTRKVSHSTSGKLRKPATKTLQSCQFSPECSTDRTSGERTQKRAQNARRAVVQRGGVAELHGAVMPARSAAAQLARASGMSQIRGCSAPKSSADAIEGTSTSGRFQPSTSSRINSGSILK